VGRWYLGAPRTLRDSDQCLDETDIAPEFRNLERSARHGIERRPKELGENDALGVLASKMGQGAQVRLLPFLIWARQPRDSKRQLIDRALLYQG
jgi:hypothetical protein